MSRKVELFGGEMIIEQTGMYTFCHEYGHPSIKTTVKLVGTNHMGFRTYYRKIKHILHACHYVFHENLSAISPLELSEGLIQLKEDIFGIAPLVEKFISSISGYFFATEMCFSSSMISEQSAFEHESALKKWIPVAGSTDIAHTEEHLIKACIRISKERQHAVIDHVKKTFGKIKRNDYTFEEYGDTFAFFWSDENMRSIFDNIFIKDSNNLCMRLLEKWIEKDNQNIIGIKFGAAHIPELRTALEQKGFVRKNSFKLCTISYK